ncbi:hypothetical protein CC78DRAFT_455698 [Lojkania enalia]|uniref:P-loop containing nucleoside triphosphate hydrolase protein n=1 Tax=Lojkania enalia TaxID=147567 RepID=A0A9P4N949_9PLEO|nr:hypothetical protein CC78DRAFT_455698 [Didymosphaeria enalia]
MTSTSSGQSDREPYLIEINRYVALGCLRIDEALPISLFPGPSDTEWIELLFPLLPDELKLIIGTEAAKLLEAGWIRLFLHRLPDGNLTPNIIRVYVLPEDWGRRFIDRKSKSLKSALRELLHRVDSSAEVWSGNISEAKPRPFDPWASAENVSLFYLFNKLPSPTPSPARIKDRYTRIAVEELLDSTSPINPEEYDDQPLRGLKSRLYPYQARSASIMLQRESAPQLQLDPRLEVRQSPTGESFFFGARDGSILKEPRFYEANRGGILAETMGLGKTIICLSVVLATIGHFPRIPPAYQPPRRVRDRVGLLAVVAADTLARHSIPAKAYLERLEADESINLSTCKEIVARHPPHYEIPYEPTRMNRNTKIPPPKRLMLCSGTIIVVPRNLLQQWQTEIRKHLLKGSLKILVMDTISKRAPKTHELLQYDLVLFSKNRFEQEIQDSSDEHGRPRQTSTYESPLKDLHWLRIIIDEGHSFSSNFSNAVILAKQLYVERRWVVSGTPAKDLVGVEVDISTLETENEQALLRESAVDQRKEFSLKDDTSGAAKALGSLASNFLMVRPWCDSGSEGRLVWDEYIYRHEHQYKKTFSGFSTCFLRTLEGMVVKTRPDDVERDIILPPMRHRVIYLKPCWFDKMTANLFIQVLRANAITSERSDVDYLFHKNSAKARQSLIRNLRQSNFTWTGFSLEDVASTLETSSKYLSKNDKKCTAADAEMLLESSKIVASLLESERWCALSKTHEVGMAIEDWPSESEQSFALAYPEKPAMIGITQLLEGQSHVDHHILSDDPSEGLRSIGEIGKTKLIQLAEAEDAIKKRRAKDTAEPQLAKGGVPSSYEKAQLPETSPLRNTRIVGTTSAKLSYLMGTVMKYQANEKIIIFYDGENSAYYLAQCLEMLYVNHRIYARTLDNVKRAQYVKLFNEDPDVRVLLIDVACGALGLNLNAASVVLIVNPINRPGIEAQAIKRAHRIGQTKEVLVETLILEGTIEEAIFNRAKNMSRNEHLEAKMLEDDNKIIDIIQNAKVLPIEPGECEGFAQFAALEIPQQVFGRPGREKYHRFGLSDIKIPERPRAKSVKRPRNDEHNLSKKSRRDDLNEINVASAMPSLLPIPILGLPAPLALPPGSNGYEQTDSSLSSSLFGGHHTGPASQM